MTVIQTNEWLEQYLEKKNDQKANHLEIQRDVLCAPLISHFTDTTVEEIHYHLLSYGLFLPNRSDKEVIKNLVKRDYWEVIDKNFTRLRKKWRGPKVPIFIFPSNDRNRNLQQNFNGKSGLSHPDKIFLFVTEATSKEELKALFIHEYNHVCRLHMLSKKEKELVLLDGIILEGIAEKAVEDFLGPDYLAKWTSIYPIDMAKKGWEKWIKPNLSTTRDDPHHDQLMYGGGFIPKWLGYNVGFHIVSSYMENEQKDIDGVMKSASMEILQGSSFSDW